MCYIMRGMTHAVKVEGAAATPFRFSAWYGTVDWHDCADTTASAMTAYLPTVGECASKALNDFVELRAQHGKAASTARSAVRDVAVDFTRVVLTLLNKLPAGSRNELAAALPFSNLEIELFQDGTFTNTGLATAIARRLIEWADRSPVLVEEANVHAADFLAFLNPLLDAWAQRQRADELRDRLLRV